MTLKKIIQRSLIALVLLVPGLWSTESMAGSVGLVLTRNTLTNVPDAAGTWQHEGGKVFKGALQVGYYALHRRVTNGGTTAPLNTAMVTMTLFLNTAQVQNAPRNITIEGAWDFTTGRFLGSVAAASSQYNWLQGANVTGGPGAVIGNTNYTIEWLQSFTLTLP